MNFSLSLSLSNTSSFWLETITARKSRTQKLFTINQGHEHGIFNLRTGIQNLFIVLSMGFLCFFLVNLVFIIYVKFHIRKIPETKEKNIFSQAFIYFGLFRYLWVIKYYKLNLTHFPVSWRDGIRYRHSSWMTVQWFFTILEHRHPGHKFRGFKHGEVF